MGGWYDASGDEAEWLVEDMVGVLRDVGREVGRRAPGALHGAAKGLLVAGPAGAAIGAAAGALQPPGTSAAGAAPASPPTAANPAATLVAALLRPEVLQALAALAAGQAQAQVPVAGVAVPAAAFANLVQQLAEETVARCGAPSSSARVPRYLGEALAAGEDVLDPRVRAGALLDLLIEAEQDDLDEAVDPPVHDDGEDELAEWLDVYGVREVD